MVFWLQPFQFYLIITIRPCTVRKGILIARPSQFERDLMQIVPRSAVKWSAGPTFRKLQINARKANIETFPLTFEPLL